MTELLQFLNQNSGAIQVVFSGLVTLATLIYAVLTWKLVSETRRMRKAQTDAKVTVGISSRKEVISFLDFFVRNEGVGPAYNIKFKIHQISSGDESIITKITSLGFIEKGLDYLSPNQEIRTFLTSMLERFETIIETALRVMVTYHTSSGEELSDSYSLDFSIFRGLKQLGKPDLHSIAKDMEKIQKNIQHICTGFYKLRVITQTESEYLEQQQRHVEEAEAFFEEQEAKKCEKQLLEDKT